MSKVENTMPAGPARHGSSGWRILGTIIVLAIVIIYGYPFAKDAYHWWVVKQRLTNVMNPTEKADYQNWKGDAASFARMLHERCQLSQGQGAAQCARYVIE